MGGWSRVRAGVGVATSLALGLGTAAALALVTTAPAAAGSFSVTNANDAGGGSLRQAFLDASGSATANTITVAPGLGTITLTTGELLYSSNASLDLEGNGVTIDQTTSGARVIRDTGTGAFTINQTTITGGNLTSATGQGGAIDEQTTGASLTLTNSSVVNNTATATTTPHASIIRAGQDFGVFTATNDAISGNVDTNEGGSTFGTIDSGPATIATSVITNNTDQTTSGGTDAGGIIDTLALTVTGTTVTGNRNLAAANQNADGIFDVSGMTATGVTATGNTVQTSGKGVAEGIVDNGDPTTITGSSFSSNTNAATGSGDAEGILDVAAVTITNSSIAQNTNSTASGTAFGAVDATSATVTNSTISGNTNPGPKSSGGGIDDRPAGAGAQAGSGKHAGPVGAQATSSTTLVYTTIVGNQALTGSNVFSNQAFTSFGSVVANGVGGANCDLTSTHTSNGWNFSNDTSCQFTNAASGDRQSGDPDLAALANNGPPGPTQLPNPGSPLLDAIPPGSCQADGAAGITTDERSLPRPDSSSPACDIGAVEVQPSPSPSPVLFAAFTG